MIGQICFEERNVLGRNGVLGLDLRRSMASPFTSFRYRCCHLLLLLYHVLDAEIAHLSCLPAFPSYFVTPSSPPPPSFRLHDAMIASISGHNGPTPPPLGPGRFSITHPSTQPTTPRPPLHTLLHHEYPVFAWATTASGSWGRGRCPSSGTPSPRTAA